MRLQASQPAGWPDGWPGLLHKEKFDPKAKRAKKARKKKKACWPQMFSCAECGKQGTLKKHGKTPPAPQRVRCFAHRASATSPIYVMNMDAAEEAAVALRAQGC